VEVMEIYSVSKWAYDYCALSPDSVVAGVCNNPFQRTYATVVFREYTPKPGGLEFKPGRSYYFISTSGGQPGGVQDKHGGLCASKNMKVKFEVEPIDTPESSNSKSVDGYPAAGGAFAQTKPPVKGVDDGGYDDQYQMVASAGGGQIEVDTSLAKPGDVASGSSRTHDNSREVKKQNASGGSELDVTTPRLYEIHTRPAGDVVDVKRTDYKEHYGSNAQQRRNAALVNFSNWWTLIVSLSACLYFLSEFTIS